MSKKAIKIDLSIFFEDERRMACILLNPDWKSVACLQKRVEFLFGVDSVRFLNDGCFLPPQESVEIIKLCNDIKAFIPKETLDIRKKKKSKLCTNIVESSEKCDNEEGDSQNKRRFHSVQSTDCSLSPKHKRSRSNATTISHDYEEFKGNRPCGLKAQITEDSVEEQTLVPSDSGDQYKRHNSTPKENKKSETAENNFEITSKKTHCSLKRSNQNNPFKNPKSDSGHIYFNASGEIVKSTNKKKSKSTPKKQESPKTIIFRCPLSDVTNGIESKKPRIFNFKSKNVTNSTTEKQIVEIQEDIILTTTLIQNARNELSLTNEKTTTSNVDKQKETNESIKETDYLNEKSYLHNRIATGTTIITENDKEENISGISLEVSHKEETNVTDIRDESQMEVTNIDEDITETQNDSQTNINGNVSETQDKSQSHIDQNVTEEQNVSQMDRTNIDEKVGEAQNITEIEQNNVDEASIMSIDCVDLSIDAGDELKLEDSIQVKRDLNADDQSNELSSDIEEISEIIDLNESNSTTSVYSSSPVKNIRISNILPFSTNLTNLPNAEDIIIFKVPYVKNKKKITTDFMAGEVKYVNKRTKMIKVLIVDGVSELWQVPNKFVCNMDDSQDYVKLLQLKLSDMCEAKLFSES